MKFDKKKIFFIGCFLIVVVICIYFFYPDESYSYEWVPVKDSAIGQYRLYINDSRGRHIDGVARLVYINGKTKRVMVDKEGLLYVKSIVVEVRNPNKR